VSHLCCDLRREPPYGEIYLVREKRESRARAIKVLDHALSGNAGTDACETFVEALGLKTLFSALMGKSISKKKAVAVSAGEETSHVLGIISSLFTNLPSDSASRIRVLAKFAESGYEKVEKLLEIREGATGRLKAVDKEIEAEKKVRSRLHNALRPEATLFICQNPDRIMA
jgi:beta-catenin-like protein 1